MVGLGFGGLRMEFAGVGIFDQKSGQLFVVEEAVRGELLEWGFGCWRGDVLVSSWEDFGEVWWSEVSGIFKGSEVGFCG